ncbi:hypothetical protein DXG01_009243 [Tephrocybe rancida]|nr:hypothetical protein DXG01_009243 [Tephrocybe rancida]
MDSLDDIWDEPVDEAPAPRSTSAPREPLFLADSDDESVPRPPPQNVQDIDVDIDAMFAEVEEEDDPFNIKPLTSNLNTEALTRAAEARHKKSMPSLTPHAIMSSSPPRDMGDEQTTKKTGGDKGKDGQKEKRKPMRLDEGRLLGPTGFPKLIKDTKNFRTKGKGHEATDLNRLLQVYGYWTHEMYPKTTFRDTVERVEKLCHSKRMHVALSVWRDEAHGLVNGRQPEDDGEIIDLTENPDGAPAAHSASSRASSPVSGGAAYASSSSRPGSRPPSSGSELDDDDDFDIDAIIRDEEARLARERGVPGSTVDPPQIGDKGKSVSVEDDDDAAMWETLDSAHGTISQTTQPLAAASGMDEDDAMWDELDALQSGVQPVHSPPARDDEDQDMWDAVQELEDDTRTAKGADAAVVALIPQIDPFAEDDWDSVYA